MLKDITFLDTVKQMPVMSLPVRTAIVRLSNARVMVSPGSNLTAEQLRGAGEITDIVAPSLLHTGGIPVASRAFPEARVWGPEGVRKKQPRGGWTHTLGEDPWPFQDELQLVLLDGMPDVREYQLFHVASKTLFSSDFLFNVEWPQGLGAWLVMHLFGTYRHLGVSRLFKFFQRDHAAFQASLGRLMSLDIDSLVPTHGSTVEGGGKARLEAALRERGMLA